MTVIGPGRGLLRLEARELWRYRELWWVMALRDLRIRYKQTMLGAAWAVIQPVTAMVVLHLFFGKALGLEDRVGGAAYPVFLYAGLLPWNLFGAVVNAGSSSLVSNAHIVSKVYFPRLLLPLSAVGAPLVDFAIAFVVLLGMMLWYGTPMGWDLLLVVPLVATVLTAGAGLGVLLSAWTVSFRDFRHAVPFVLQVWFFATPVIYPTTILPERFQWLLALNPLSGPIEGLRAVCTGGTVDVAGWAVSAAVAGLVLTVGVVWFGATERRFADVI